MIGAFVVLSRLTSRIAGEGESRSAQCVALGIYATAGAILFVLLLFVADYNAPEVTQNAALITHTSFPGLTVAAGSTRKDFSCLGGIFTWGGVMALVAVVAGFLFGFQLVKSPRSARDDSH